MQSSRAKLRLPGKAASARRKWSSCRHRDGASSKTHLHLLNTTTIKRLWGWQLCVNTTTSQHNRMLVQAQPVTKPAAAVKPAQPAAALSNLHALIGHSHQTVTTAKAGDVDNHPQETTRAPPHKGWNLGHTANTKGPCRWHAPPPNRTLTRRPTLPGVPLVCSYCRDIAEWDSHSPSGILEPTSVFISLKGQWHVCATLPNTQLKMHWPVTGLRQASA